MTSNSAHRFLLSLQAIVFAVAILYFGKPVLVPLIVAGLLTFLLRPSVVWLERHRVRRGFAIGLTGFGVLLAIGTVGWILSRQLQELTLHVDDYRVNLRTKLESLQRFRPEFLVNFRSIVAEVDEATHKDNKHAAEDNDASGTPSTSAKSP